MKLNYLIKYKSFNSVKEMDEMVQKHISFHKDKMTASIIKVLYALAGYSTTYYGVSHLKCETIASHLKISVRTVYRAIKVLNECGIITKVKTTKSTGNGASIYVIAPNILTQDVSHQMSQTCQSLETHVKPTVPTETHVNFDTDTKNLSTSLFNPYVNNVNNVNARGNFGIANVIKELLSSYNEEAINEINKIAFGSIKKYISTHKMEYAQMENIVVNCANALSRKSGVKNVFAMYSAMIKRQVEQQSSSSTVEEKKRSFVKKTKEIVPDWFEKRNDCAQVVKENVSNIDFELERQKIMMKLGVN